MTQPFRSTLQLSAMCLCIGVTAAGAQVASQPSTQPAEASPPLEDIIVTAQKRAERAQDSPLAITAVSGDSLRSRQVSDIRSLTALAPNVDFGEAHGIARLAIRGIGFNETNPGGEGRVAYHVDGVYMSRPEAVLATFFDVERVEVLRGPQGTLYGRNAVAGTINVITRDPGAVPEGYVQASIGNYSAVQLEGGASLPLSEGISLRLAGATSDRSGYGRNTATGQKIDDFHTRSGRAKLKLEPTAALQVVLATDYFRQNDSSGHLRWIRPGTSPDPAAGMTFLGTFADDPRDSNSDTQPLTERELWGLSSTVNWQLNDIFELTSVTAYRHTTYHQTWDNDQTEKQIDISIQDVKSKQFSQEVRAAIDSGPAKFVAGGYYFTETTDGSASVPLDRVLVGLPSQFSQGYFIGGRLKTEAAAVFGQASFSLAPELSIDLGGRYSAETKKKIDEVFQFDVTRPYDVANPLDPLASIAFDKTTVHQFTPKATISYKPNRDVMFYATWAKGFKSGGFNLGGLQPAFEPEKITSYEAGMKLETFDGRLRANLAGFYYDYSNLQVSQTKINHTEVVNAASARLYGMEAECIALPARNVQVDFHLGLLRTKFLSFETEDVIRPQLGLLDLSGNRLPQAPRYTAGLGAQHSWDATFGRVVLRGEARRMAKIYFTPFNTTEFSEGAYGTYDAYLNIDSRSDTWSVGAFVRNISNGTHVVATAEGSTLQGAPVFGTVTPPRTFGVRLGYKF